MPVSTLAAMTAAAIIMAMVYFGYRGVRLRRGKSPAGGYSNRETPVHKPLAIVIAALMVALFVWPVVREARRWRRPVHRGILGRVVAFIQRWAG